MKQMPVSSANIVSNNVVHSYGVVERNVSPRCLVILELYLSNVLAVGPQSTLHKKHVFI